MAKGTFDLRFYFEESSKFSEESVRGYVGDKIASFKKTKESVFC